LAVKSLALLSIQQRNIVTVKSQSTWRVQDRVSSSV